MYMSPDPLPFRYNSFKHPQPVEDRPLIRELKQKGLPDLDSGLFHYGFRSIKQLKKWINRKDHRCEMSSQGFVVKHYIVGLDQIARGDTQVVFNRDAAKHIGTLNLANI